MNQQPDTSTLKGKIAVMQAALKYGRFQIRTDDNDLWHNNCAPICRYFFDFQKMQYRIHPDDLNPPQPKKWRAWIRGENPPVGSLLRSIFEPKVTLLVITSMPDGFYTILDAQVKWSDLKTAFSDVEISYDGGNTWQPCGVLE